MCKLTVGEFVALNQSIVTGHKISASPLSSSGDISIGIKCAPGVVGPAEADIDFDIIRNDNDTFTVKYTPPGAGSYTIMVLFADQVSPGLWQCARRPRCILCMKM